MPVGKIINTKITIDPSTALKNIIAFIEGEIYGLSDQTELLYKLNAGELRSSVETMLYYVSKTIDQFDGQLPADFTYVRKEDI